MPASKTLPASPFPLSWPATMPRTAERDRRRSAFGSDHAGDVALGAARQFLLGELGRLGVATEHIVITSNIPARRGDLTTSDDTGIAVWFILNGETRVMACDRWVSHGENLRAIGLSIEALRSLDRWGVADATANAMDGFRPALPAATGSSPDIPRSNALAAHAQRQPIPVVARDGAPAAAPHWRTVLLAQDLGADLTAIKASYRRLIAIVHPDACGQTEHAVRLNAAWAQAQAELAGA